MSTPTRLHQVAQPIFVSEVYIMYNDTVLLFKRSEDKKKFPGFWSLPGGHIDEGEDPLGAAIREVKEETSITITPEDIQLKVVALHHHLDREELYIAFAFVATIHEQPDVLENHKEGSAHWVSTAKALKLENVFEPVKRYFPHVFEKRPGIVYNNSEWKDSQLVRVLSETVDSNG